MYWRQKQALLKSALIPACLAASVVFGSGESAGNDRLKAAFLERYLPHYKHLAECYGNMRMSVTSSQIGWPAFEGGDRVERWSILASEGQFRIDVEVVDSGGQSDDGLFSRVANPREVSFRVSKQPGAKDYVLEEMGANYHESLEGLRGYANIAVSPFGVLEATFPELLESGVHVITKMEDVVVEGNNCVRLRTVGKNNARATCEYLFLVDHHWMLKEMV